MLQYKEYSKIIEFFENDENDENYCNIHTKQQKTKETTIKLEKKINVSNYTINTNILNYIIFNIFE